MLKLVEFPEAQTPEVVPYRSQDSTRTKNQETDRKGRKIPEACQQKLPATSQVHRNQKSKTVKHRYLDSPGNDTPQNPRPSLRPHRNSEVDTVGKIMGEDPKRSEKSKPINTKRSYNDNTEQMLTDYVEELMETIPDARGWGPQVRKEAKVKLRSLVEEEIRGKMISPLALAKEDLIEVRMTFNKVAYTNLLNGNLPLINVDPATGEDLAETSFSQRIINRVRKNDGGLQEFRVRFDRKKRYEAVTSKPGGNDALEQSFEMPGGFDITSRLVPKEDEPESSASVMSKNWETSVQALRIYTEKNLRCFECKELVREEIGVHITMEHLRTSVTEWNKPFPY